MNKSKHDQTAPDSSKEKDLYLSGKTNKSIVLGILINTDACSIYYS